MDQNGMINEGIWGIHSWSFPCLRSLWYCLMDVWSLDGYLNGPLISLMTFQLNSLSLSTYISRQPGPGPGQLRSSRDGRSSNVLLIFDGKKSWPMNRITCITQILGQECHALFFLQIVYVFSVRICLLNPLHSIMLFTMQYPFSFQECSGSNGASRRHAAK